MEDLRFPKYIYDPDQKMYVALKPNHLQGFHTCPKCGYTVLRHPPKLTESKQSQRRLHQ
jgi:hypothetical protein